MRTLTIKEAAKLLKIHPETLRARASAGQIPALKPGRSWVFIEEDLADWLQRSYSNNAQQAPRLSRNGGDKWQYINVAQHGGCGLPRQMGKEYANLLGLATKS